MSPGSLLPPPSTLRWALATEPSSQGSKLVVSLSTFLLGLELNRSLGRVGGGQARRRRWGP